MPTILAKFTSRKAVVDGLRLYLPSFSLFCTRPKVPPSSISFTLTHGLICRNLSNNSTPCFYFVSVLSPTGSFSWKLFLDSWSSQAAKNKCLTISLCIIRCQQSSSCSLSKKQMIPFFLIPSLKSSLNSKRPIKEGSPLCINCFIDWKWTCGPLSNAYSDLLILIFYPNRRCFRGFIPQKRRLALGSIGVFCRVRVQGI